MLKTQFLFCIVSVLLISVSPLLVAQEILTAEKYFDSISEIYGAIEDYQADITITQGEDVMKGVLFYKLPNLLRIDFTDPEEQVLAVDGESLTIYIPGHSVIMHQKLKKRSSSTIATMASSQGLQLLKRNYSVAYLLTPNPVPLEAEEAEDPKEEQVPQGEGVEQVIKLKLDWRSTDEGFRQIVMSVGENGLIRRIIGVTVGYENIQFDFENILVNQNIPEARFQYDSPASANVFENFLFEPEE